MGQQIAPPAPSAPAAYAPIADYALIGDCRGAGLVSRDGSLDWLCIPRFDSPPLFAALLDAANGGRFRIRPRGPYRVARRYLPDTNILETTFHAPTGSALLRDLLPVASEEAKRAEPLPEHELIREVVGLSGEIELELLYAPRPLYGRLRPRLEDRGALGIWCEVGRGLLCLRCEPPFAVQVEGASVYGRAHLRAGDSAVCAMTYSETAPATLASLGDVARRRVAGSADWWRGWAARCTYRGPYRDAVVRSALALKLLMYAPSGAVVAAPTTSLPERIGGARNWDYRYCWLRDASFTVRALDELGYTAESAAFADWMLHATRLTWPELQVVYDIFGEADLPERVIPTLEGYRGSAPVRVGNDAHGQLQLDVYGEVLDAAARFHEPRGRLDGDTASLLRGLGRTVCRRWREPDEGIWEGRGGRFQHTFSKVMCWVALDRLIRLHEAGLLDAPDLEFRAERAAIRAEVERRGYNERLGSYTRLLDGDDLDASLLLLSAYGYARGDGPRMRSTCDRIRRDLGRDGLVYRYDAADGLPPGEGAFGICSFWAVECLARGDQWEEASRMFEHVLGYANDVGLFAEEIEPETGAQLGNFPQAFTHVGLINAALTLANRDGVDAAGGRRHPSAGGVA